MDNNYSPFVSSGNPETIVLIELSNTVLRTEISSDSIIPDRISDVDAVLLCTATPRIDGQFISDGILEIEGSITYHILLATENNSLSSLTLTEPFESKSKLSGLNNRCELLLTPQMEYVTARLLNPRKINLRSQVNLSLRVFDPVSTGTEIVGAESLDDEMNLQRFFQTIPAVALTKAEERKVPVSYDIALDSSAPAASEIVSARLRLHPSEIRLRADNADLRTRAVVSIIYRTDENNYFPVEKSFDIEKSLSLPTPAGEWQASVFPGDLQCNINANSYGEMKIIELDFTYDILLSLLDNRTVSLVNDIYSTEFESETDTQTLETLHLHRVYSSGLSVNASVSRDAVKASELRAILGGSVTLKDTKATYDQGKEKLIIDGTAVISLVGENGVLDESESLYLPITFDTPFRCELESGEDLSEADLILDCQITDLKFRTDSLQVYVDFELSSRIIALRKESHKYIQTLKLDRSSPIDRTTAPITLCYPSGRETLWDIAKYYKINPDNIAVANALQDNRIDGKKVLLIPRIEPKRAVFSKVI